MMRFSVGFCLLLACGCAGSRRQEPAPPVADRRVELNVIPHQELKPGRPFLGFGASVPLPGEPAVSIDSNSFSDQP